MLFVLFFVNKKNSVSNKIAIGLTILDELADQKTLAGMVWSYKLDPLVLTDRTLLESGSGVSQPIRLSVGQFVCTKCSSINDLSCQW
jgi:hypothetical protein